jgi:hypothetical protein
MRARCATLGLSVLLFVSSNGSAGEGFGFVKKGVYLNRTVPPSVYVEGTRVQIMAKSQDPSHAAAAERLKSLLESQLLGADKRFTLDPAHPETLIEVTIVQDQGSERRENRRGTQRRQVGKDSKGRPTYQDYEVTIEYQIVHHEFNAAYKVRDLRSSKNLDADIVKSTFDKAVQTGDNIPELSAVESSAIDLTVNRIVRRLAPSSEQIEVLLPKGSLADLSNLANANLWNKYLESLEGLAPKGKPEDESYRQYGLGLAYEALAYSAESPETTLKYLQQASFSYNKALELNPREKYFSLGYNGFFASKNARPPLERVKSALSEYQKTKEFKDAYQQAKGVDSSGGAKSLTSGAKPDGLFNNESVIEMVRAGLSDEIILTAIDAAPKPIFDVSPQGLIALAQGNVSKKVIQRMQAVGRKKSVVRHSSKMRAGER